MLQDLHLNLTVQFMTPHALAVQSCDLTTCPLFCLSHEITKHLSELRTANAMRQHYFFLGSLTHE